MIYEEDKNIEDEALEENVHPVGKDEEERKEEEAIDWTEVRN